MRSHNMALQNKIVFNIEQNLTAVEKATARKNIGAYNPSDGTIRLLNDNGTIIGDFTTDQADNKDITISRDSLDVYSKSEVDAKIPGKMTVVDLGTSIFSAAPFMNSQTSGVILSDLGNIPNPIQLEAGKTYLIQPTVVGTADYTLGATHNRTSRFSVELQLVEADVTEGSLSIFGRCVPIAATQFYLRTTNGSNEAGYRFITTIGSHSLLYTPATDKTFTKIVATTNGNVLGGDGSTRCYMDFRLGSLIITEV